MTFQNITKHKYHIDPIIGSDCSATFNACVDEPCLASVCDDLTPEEEAAQMRAFTCGACNDGYEKTGDADSNCQGK